MGCEDVVLRNHIVFFFQKLHLSMLPLQMWIDLFSQPDTSKLQQITQALQEKFVIFLVSTFFVNHTNHLDDADICM